MGYLLDTIHSRLERRPYTLESIFWDAEAHKLSGPALVRFVVSELKAKFPAQGERMARGEEIVTCQIS
jgi:hypothetical protein